MKSAVLSKPHTVNELIRHSLTASVELHSGLLKLLSYCMGVTRERETETETDRQTERGRERQRQSDKQAGREAETGRQAGRQTDR